MWLIQKWTWKLDNNSYINYWEESFSIIRLGSQSTNGFVVSKLQTRMP